MKHLFILIMRFWNGLQRPSKKENLLGLKKRGEDIQSVSIREAVIEDMPALVNLHVVTWNDTYPGVRNPPTHRIREFQWHKAFDTKDEYWSCFVAENKQGELIGFAQSNRYVEHLQGFEGQLNKIYLLRQYQRLGLGRKLFGSVVKKFLSQDISSMLLFSEPENPSIAFYEVMGGERLLDASGKFHGGYGWRNLKNIVNICSIG